MESREKVLESLSPDGKWKLFIYGPSDKSRSYYAWLTDSPGGGAGIPFGYETPPDQLTVIGICPILFSESSYPRNAICCFVGGRDVDVIVGNIGHGLSKVLQLRKSSGSAQRNTCRGQTKFSTKSWAGIIGIKKILPGKTLKNRSQDDLRLWTICITYTHFKFMAANKPSNPRFGQ